MKLVRFAAIAALPILIGLSSSGPLSAQVETQSAIAGQVISNVDIENLPTGRSLKVFVELTPNVAPTAVTVTQNGLVRLPAPFQPPSDPEVNVTYGKCSDGTVYATGDGVDVIPILKSDCKNYTRIGSSPWDKRFTLDASFVGKTSSKATSHTSMDNSGSGIHVEVRTFGGIGFINGNNPAAAGVDGDVRFHLWNELIIAPTAGVQWLGSSQVQMLGGGTPPATFINTSDGSWIGNFGGELAHPIRKFEVGVRGGAAVVRSSITQVSGFCTITGGCSVSSSTKTHSTGVGSFVAGYASYSICPHFGVFAEYDHHFLPTIQAQPGGSLPPINLHTNEAYLGIRYKF